MFSSPLVVLCLLSCSITLISSKECKKLDACRCEMNDGSGIVDLNGISFKKIPEPDNPQFKYDFTPCTSSSTQDKCTKAYFRQLDTYTSSYFPCGSPKPTFTVDSSGNVVVNYPKVSCHSYSRSTQITLVCDEKDKKGTFGKGIKQTTDGTSYSYSIYTGTLSIKNACPQAAGLSTGSILLIIFFPLILLYLICGIMFNVLVKHEKSVPEVFPNHTFWADFPFLFKDGCVFTFVKMKNCCSFVCAKARGKDYSEI